MLQQKGKLFKWPHTGKCCQCGSKLWGHGFVLFHPVDLPSPLHLKRLRCNKCGVVVTLKPDGYAKGFRSSLVYSYAHLREYLKTKKPHPRQKVQSQVYFWLKRFKTNLQMDFAWRFPEKSMLEWLDYLYERNIPFLA